MKMCIGGYVGWGDNNCDMLMRWILENYWEFCVYDGIVNIYVIVVGFIVGVFDF